MPRKKSVKHSAQVFCNAADDIAEFLTKISANQSDQHVSWLYDYGIIRLYREFESLVLHLLVGAINNNTATISATTGIEFPKHLTDEVCTFLIKHTGYFDFKGRSGLIKTLQKFVPDDHDLVTSVKKNVYKQAIERLSALRNFATHESPTSKRAALTAIGGKRIGSSGAWLKREDRFQTIVDSLKSLATEIERSARY
jgi:hypothetical protein